MGFKIETIKKYKPEFNNCICGGAARHTSGSQSGYSGYASVLCQSCGLGMTETTGNLGYGVTLDDLSEMLEKRWNAVMKDKGCQQ